MKKILLLLISCVFISMSIQAQDEGVFLPESMTVNVGETVTLTPTFNPASLATAGVSWSVVGDPIVEISPVETDGVLTCIVKGLGVGETEIEVLTVDGSFKDTCVIRVVQPVTDMVLNVTLMNLTLGEDSVLRAIITPADASNDSIIWISDDSSIVNIRSTDANRFGTACYITAVKPGATFITAKTVDGGIERTCQVIVTADEIDEFSLDQDSVELLKGALVTIKAKIRPLEGTDKRVRWSIVNNDIAKITTSGYDTICTIEALSAGETKLVAFTQDSLLTDTCVITVLNMVHSLVIEANKTLDVKTDDSTAVLTVTVNPANAINASLLWVNKNPDIVKIDSITNDSTMCYIKGFRAGVDTIYVMTRDSLVKSNECIITVNKILADSVRITKPVAGNDTITLNAKESFELSTTIYPLRVTNDTLKVESTFPDIVKVDSTETGTYLRALKGGEAKVYVLAADGSDKVDSCVIRVIEVPVTGISLSKDTIRIYEQQIDSIFATLLPANATNDSIEWISSNNSVVSISPVRYGSVCSFKGLSVDTAFIYAVSKEDASIKDSCVVIVREQFLFLEADTATASSKKGIIELSLLMSSNEVFTGYFKLELPKGFTLSKRNGNEYKTELADRFKASSELDIIPINDSTYTFDISLKPTVSSSIKLRSDGKDTVKIMDIAYMINDDELKNSPLIYDAKFSGVEFLVGENYIVKEDVIIVKIKSFDDPTSNEIIDNDETISAYMYDSRLYVNTDKAETVYVYSLNGSLIFTGNKSEGPAVFNINSKENILIVKGSSGWANKVFNK